jgi:hypothetical protein
MIIITRGWHNRPNSGRSAEWTELKPTPHYTNFNLIEVVLTAVVMRSTIIWDIMPGSPLKVSQPFGVTYRLYIQGRISRLSACLLLSYWYFA